ncbi:hypothetical protein Enr17x_25560 [Gimesia fumaroli]|uniref:Uncharacterized protein n=1 Tax=Gimesia fumaroli TaxID=2527976 RepID=A0A518IBN7_9PLAN|nr:hypothetical protein Enr17x_25560 [Gimesia fumaroli]
MRNSVNEASGKFQEVAVIVSDPSLKRHRSGTKTTAHRKLNKGRSMFGPLKTGVLNSESINRLWRMHYKKTSHSRARR